MDNSTTFHSEYEKKSDVSVAPFMLSVPGFVKALFSRKYTETGGPLVLTTVVVDGDLYSASCSDDLILFRFDTSAASVQRVRLPTPASCPGALFIVKDDLGLAGTLNPSDPGVTYKIQIDAFTQLIDGNTKIVLDTQHGAMWFVSDGTNYNTIEAL